MSNIRNNNPTVCIKKLMIFMICRNKNIGSGTYRITEQEPSGTAAHSNTQYRFIQQSGMTDNVQIQPFLEDSQKSIALLCDRQITDNSRTHCLQFVVECGDMM